MLAPTSNPTTMNILHFSDLDPVFWTGFGSNAPRSFEGLTVLEIGCGTGARSLEMASLGATVLGIDPFGASIKAARTREHPRMAFRCCTIEELEEEFDIVVSENAFEHIVNVEQTLSHICKRLKIGGRAYIGFGPLFHSPYGDHGWMRKHLPFKNLPWSHIYLPRKWSYRLISRSLGYEVRNTINWPYLGLNQLTMREFIKLFEQSGMNIISLNRGKHASIMGRIIDIFANFPILGKYLSDRIYVVLEKE